MEKKFIFNKKITGFFDANKSVEAYLSSPSKGYAARKHKIESKNRQMEGNWIKMGLKIWVWSLFF